MKATVLKIAMAAGLMAGVATGAMAQQKNVTIGVSIPAATHGWTGGVVYHAQETAKQLEKTYPGIKVVVKTSPDGASQANALDDLTSQKVDALVVLPFNSDELTNPVREIKKRGTDVTPEELRRRLAPKGPGRATLVVTRTAPGPGPEGPGRGGAGPAEQRVVIVVETVD